MRRTTPDILPPLILILLAATLAAVGFAPPSHSSGTYIPPPPPKAVPAYNEAVLARGADIFERGIYREGRLSIYHHLGPRSCSSCHTKDKGFDKKKLARDWERIDLILLRCVRDRAEGEPQFLDAKTRAALKTYLFYTYNLHRYRLSS